MLVIPTQAVENSYVPTPGMVSYSIFGLFMLEDWQIDLHPQTSSCPSCLVTLSRCSHHGWWMGALSASPIGTPFPLKREIHWKCLLVIMGALSSMASSTSTHMLRTNIPLLSPWLLALPFLTSLQKHLPPNLASTHWYCMLLWGFGLSSLFHGGNLAPWSFLFSMMASAMAWWPFSTALTIVSTWASLLAQLTGLSKWNTTSPTSSKI